MPGQSPFFHTTTGKNTSEKSRVVHIPRSQRQQLKRDISSSSISKKFFHLTRRIGSGLSTSSSKHGNEKTSVSSKSRREQPQSMSARSYKSDQFYYTKPKSSQRQAQSHSTVSCASSLSSTKRNFDVDDDHLIPNNGTNSTADNSITDDLSTALSDDYGCPQYVPHSFKAGKHTFIVDSKYSFIRVIGSGAYGVVVSAHDKSADRKVAIKMVPKAFHDEIDAKRILREIKLLKHFKHENVIGILDMMPPLANYVEGYNDVYITTDLMETDLHRIIYSKQNLSVDHVQYFVYQILRALKYIHSANVLHRDLKPSNLLVNSNCDLKVCDFGLARGIIPEDDLLEERNGGSMLLTEYVVTRWYRAPEIMLSCHEYTKPIDIWSVGCIFAELLGRKPYFPGEDYIDQLTIITNKLGKLSEEDLDFVTSEKAKRFMRKLPDKPVVSFRRQFPGTPPEALDMLSQMLQIHPEKRITVKEALEHPFMAQLHNPHDEPEAEAPFDFGFEDDDLHRVRLQELIWEEVGSFRPSCLPVPPRKHERQSHSSDRRFYEA